MDYWFLSTDFRGKSFRSKVESWISIQTKKTQNLLECMPHYCIVGDIKGNRPQRWMEKIIRRNGRIPITLGRIRVVNGEVLVSIKIGKKRVMKFIKLLNRRGWLKTPSRVSRGAGSEILIAYLKNEESELKAIREKSYFNNLKIYIDSFMVCNLGPNSDYVVTIGRQFNERKFL